MADYFTATGKGVIVKETPNPKEFDFNRCDGGDLPPSESPHIPESARELIRKMRDEMKVKLGTVGE